MSKVFLIIGASSDIGIALIQKLIEVENRQDIIIIAHYNKSKDDLEKIKEQYKDSNIYLIQADLSILQQTKAMISSIQNLNIEPTHIINLSASNFKYTRISEWDSELIQKDMNIQVYSFAEIVKAFIPSMVKKHYGKIVVMLTAYTIGIPPQNMSGYVTVKYALLGLMKSIDSDFGNQGININGISPAMINTKFVEGIGRKIKEITAQKNPKHRNLEVRDVIPTIYMLLSDEAEFISGANINLSGCTD
jgi:3-oxoacyl-[acyl-carrier protein] reductase